MVHEDSGKPKKTLVQKVGLVAGIALSLVIWAFLDLDPGNPLVTRMAAVAVLMAVWWITDAIPLFATAMLPIVLFPLMGILKGGDTAPVYINSTIILFIGGFMIALAMERWELHRRIALFIIRAIGGGPSRIILGFMIAAGFLSMWISNTATAIMMVPIALAIVVQMEDTVGKEETSRFSTGLMLAIAYACSVGGVATLVGTPPNLSFARIFQISFPDAEPISFGTWFLMGFPLSVIMLICIWLLITRLFFRVPEGVHVDRSVIDNEWSRLGRASFEEVVVLIVFSLTALLWVFRKPLDVGIVKIPGWSALLPNSGLIDDGTVAMFMALSLFLIPTRSPNASSPSVMSIDVFRRLPWNIVLLFGGGFALAKGFQVSGLSEFVGQRFGGLSDVSPLLVILIVCLTITFLTELTSNTATTEMILPILAAVAVAMRVNPLMLMVPATLAASQAFMMPVATPPNAIVFGSQRVSIAEMARGGLLINLIGTIVITAVFYFVGTRVFGIDPSAFPDWAETAGAGGP